jgi:hypothetical protein
MPPVVRFAVPVIFRTPVSKDALAVSGINMKAKKLIVAILFVRGSSVADVQGSANPERLCVEPAENGMRIA